MTDHKPDLTLWTFKFVVRASTWNDAAKILKDRLNIEAIHDASDRQINGLYLISSFVNEDKLTKDFYCNITDSKDIAVHSDAKSDSLYPKILKETQAVEEKLRWLLLHVSDAIDSFAGQLSNKKNKDAIEQSTIITNESLDPITSMCTFEFMMGLLKLDQSWARDGVTTDQMRTLIDSSADFANFKKSYIEKTKKKTIWDSISNLVLQTSVTWDSVEDKFDKIRRYRNKCAHFNTVTDDDLSQARHIREELDTILTTKKTTPRLYVASLRALNEQLAQTLKTISQSYVTNINTPALTALINSQIDTVKLSQSMQKIVQQSLSIPTDTILRTTQNMMPHLDIPCPTQSLINSINLAMSPSYGLYETPKDDKEETDGPTEHAKPDGSQTQNPDKDKNTTSSDNKEKKR